MKVVLGGVVVDVRCNTVEFPSSHTTVDVPAPQLAEEPFLDN